METENSIANTINDPNTINNISKEIFNMINEVRLNPIKIANKLTQVMSYINKRDNILREPRRPPHKLVEGIKAFEEVITFLKNFTAIEPLLYDDSLGKIAQDHANDIGPKNLTQSDSSDNKTKFEDRFKRFGTYSQLFECIHLGDIDPLRVVIDLIVCDGDSKRKNREIILSNNLGQIGIGVFENAINSTNKNNLNNLVIVDLTKNWKSRTKIEKINEANIPNKKYLSKLYNLKNELDSSNISNDRKVLKEVISEEELISKYEKELDQEICFDHCRSRREEKQIISENDKLKIIKKVTLEFEDRSIRRVILSKTWKR